MKEIDIDNNDGEQRDKIRNSTIDGQAHTAQKTTSNLLLYVFFYGLAMM